MEGKGSDRRETNAVMYVPWDQRLTGVMTMQCQSCITCSTHCKSFLSSDMVFNVSALGLAEYLLMAFFSLPCWCPPASQRTPEPAGPTEQVI